jgi:hypothetical protein
MATAELDEVTMTPAPAPLVPTGALEDAGLMAIDPSQAGNRQAWRLMSERVSMMRFVIFPDLEAEGLTPPCLAAVDEALRLVSAMSKMGAFPPPSRVIPNGEGGIVFERWTGGDLDRIEVFANRQVYLSQFEGGRRLVHRQIR